MDTPLTYKGLPLVRSKDEFYYGNPNEKVIVYLKVLSTKQVGNQTVSDKIHVSLISTDTTLDPIRRMIKQGVKNGLYSALDVGAVWLQSELNK
ncbi:MAG: hypothetical protein IJ410_06705 [Oscillospiraceae bacterium]|nr:hypothetical protein [Oscillospiraceae bacterium]